MTDSPSDAFVEAINIAAVEFIHSSGLGLSEEGQAGLVQPLIMLMWAIMKNQPEMTPESFGRIVGAAAEVIAERTLVPTVLQ